MALPSEPSRLGEKTPSHIPSLATVETTQYSIKPSILNGKVRVSGAKNSVLRLMAASILTPEAITLSNYPATLRDAQVHTEMLKALGKSCDVSDTTLCITETAALSTDLKWDGRSIRNTLLILGALVARTGRGSVPLPGGCKLGERKHDLHVMLLEALGARVWEEDGRLNAQASGGLQGADIHLPIRSTGATENALLCASLAQGTSTIWGPHIRPEIIDLIDFLTAMGADITVYGQERIEVIGAQRLGGVKHRVMPDNMEALTWLIGAVITGGDVEIFDFPTKHLEVPLTFLRESGARFHVGDESLIVRGGTCYPVEISTGPYPGINSDMQPLFAVYGACARGQSRIVDLRFPGRYGYAEELAKMGLLYSDDDNLLTIRGGADFKGARVRALDLRAGIALTLAALVADGETIIEDAWQIERGYDRIIPKLRALGVDVSVR
ncbi:MAG: UDP-N-acetylglucosamine 1-carboxyvinyltransferase [Pseudomonadota bacterium]